MQLGIREAQAAENTEPAAWPEGTFFGTLRGRFT